jgi:5'(3')-deoxyribonucleotidase
MTKNIALDLDGVIADIGGAIEESLVNQYGFAKNDYDYTKWLTTHHDCELSNEMMGTSVFWKNLKPFEDAWHQVNDWFSRGYDVYIVTARRAEASMSVTQQWLDEWKINTMIPIFCKMGEKHHVIKEINPLFMVEDNPNEVKTLLDEGVNAYLRRAWYNEPYWEELPTIGSLLELKIDD